MAEKIYTVPRLTVGLNTQDPTTSLGPGELSVADNVVVNHGVLKSAPGYDRLTKERPRNFAYSFNGVDQYFKSPNLLTSVSNLTNLKFRTSGTADGTMEIVFKIDSLPTDFATTSGYAYSTLIYSGFGMAAGADFDVDLTHAMAIRGGTDGQLFVEWFWEVAPAATWASLLSDVPLELGEWYHAAVTFVDSTLTTSLYVHKPGTSVGTPVTLAATDLTGAYTYTLYSLGAALTNDRTKHDRESIYQLRGSVQEFRIWDVARDAGQLETYDDRQLTDVEVTAETDLRYYQRLTGKGDNSYYFESESGTTGNGNDESPLLHLSQRDATWRGDGHVLGSPPSGDYTLDLDGYGQYLIVPNAYDYRTQTTRDDGGLPFADYFAVSLRATLLAKSDADEEEVVFQYTHVPSEDWTTNDIDQNTVGDLSSTNLSTGSECQCAIQIHENGGVYQFRGLMYHEDSSSIISFTSEETALAGGLSTGVEYVVTLGVNVPDRTVSMFIDSEAVQTSSAWTSGNEPLATPDTDVGTARKYALSIGAGISRSRQDLSLPSDPNGYEAEYNRQFNGQIRQVIVAALQDAWGIPFVHSLNRDNERLNLDKVTSSGLTLSSVWFMDEGKGPRIVDYGQTGNHLEFREDPDHVWTESGLETVEASAIRGMLDHRYTTPTGPVRKMVALAGGTAYEVDQTTGALTAFANGFRNDDFNIVSAMKYRDSHILCCGSGGRGNYQLYKENLWRLDIAAPEGYVPVGLADQKKREAGMRPGEYLVGFTYWSEYTGKRSPLGPLLRVTVRRGRTNMAFGDVAEANQTYPSFTSVNKEPFNFDATAGNKSGFRAAAWVGATGAKLSTDPDWWESDPSQTLPALNPTKYKRTLFDNDDTPDENIKDVEDVPAGRVVRVLEDDIGKIFAEADEEGFVTIKGSFIGSDAHFQLQDLSTPSNPDVISSAVGSVLNFGATGGPPVETAVVSGTGDKSHGINLPKSSDPQVTHLEIWRSLANDNVLRLAEKVPNGTRGVVHTLPDEELVGETLDVTRGFPPPVEYVTEFAGMAVYVKDRLQPQRAYVSMPNEPWNVPLERTIDFLDGDTIEITGVARTEGALILFKDDTTFVLTPTTNAVIPFYVETRSRDIGCVAPFGVTNIHESVYFPSEKGLYRFDTSSPMYLSEVIEPTWKDGVDCAPREKIVGVHDRRNDSWLLSYPTGDTSLNGEVINDAMLLLDYSVGGTGQRVYGWTRRTSINAALFAVIPDSFEKDRVYFSDDFGYIYIYDEGTDAGPGGSFTRSLAVSAGASSTVTVPQHSDLVSQPDGYRGYWVTLVKPDSSRQTRVVTADDLASPSILTVDHAWDVAPTSADTILVGSIESIATFGELSPFGPQYVHHVTELFLRPTKRDVAANYKVQFQGLGGVINNPHNDQQAFTDLLNEQMIEVSNQKEDLKTQISVRGRRFAMRILAQGFDAPFTMRDYSFLVSAEDTGAKSTLT